MAGRNWFNILQNRYVAIALVASLLTACSTDLEIPTGLPTPPPTTPASPLAPIELRRDAALEAEIAKIAEAAKGKVGIAAVELDTGRAALLHGDDRFPMQSVYKLPISMAVMEQVRLGKLDLEEKIGVSKEDMVRQGMRSPLRDENPNGGEFTIRELVRLSIVESDGTASDVLMRVLGGAAPIQEYLATIGIDGIAVVNTEKELGAKWETQFDNYATPVAAAELLRWLNAAASVSTGNDSDRGPSPAGEELTEYQLLMKFMADSNPGAKRLKGELPPGTYVAHKTGTSGTRDAITSATNDIGVIRFPDGRRVAIAVFVSNSPADEKTREAVIAKTVKAVWDAWGSR